MRPPIDSKIEFPLICAIPEQRSSGAVGIVITVVIVRVLKHRPGLTVIAQVRNRYKVTCTRDGT